MGGGEVARYITRHGQDRLHSVVFAAAVTPYMAQTPDNPDGPLSQDQADQMTKAATSDLGSFFDEFITGFFSVDGVLKVSQEQRDAALALCHQAEPAAVLACMEAFGTTDFRDDLPAITVPALVLHGSGDATVPLEGSGRRTHAAIAQSELIVVDDAPHGFNVSHAQQFNQALIGFLSR
jgi:pimeloyl-ACP methyl ester carboxylesterase